MNNNHNIIKFNSLFAAVKPKDDSIVKIHFDGNIKATISKKNIRIFYPVSHVKAQRVVFLKTPPSAKQVFFDSHYNSKKGTFSINAVAKGDEYDFLQTLDRFGFYNKFNHNKKELIALKCKVQSESKVHCINCKKSYALFIEVLTETGKTKLELLGYHYYQGADFAKFKIKVEKLMARFSNSNSLAA